MKGQTGADAQCPPRFCFSCPRQIRRWAGGRFRRSIDTVNLWYFHLTLALLLVFLGLFIHWTVVLAGAIWPFVPVVRELLRRRRERPPPAG